MTSSSSGPVRIGVLGAARIARRFIEAVRASAKDLVAAVASRDGDCADSLGYPDGLMVQIWRSFTAARHRHAFISGDPSSINVAYFSDTGPGFPPLVEWEGWTRAMPAASIAMAMTLDANAASGHRGVLAAVVQ